MTVKEHRSKSDVTPLDSDEFALTRAVSLLTKFARYLFDLLREDYRHVPEVSQLLAELEDTLAPLRWRLGRRHQEDDNLLAPSGESEPSETEGLEGREGRGDAKPVGWASWEKVPFKGEDSPWEEE